MGYKDRDSLKDILDAVRLVQSFVQDIGQDTFNGDDMRQSAVIRQLEIIGEATKRLSPELRAGHPAILWEDMAGMRDILIHAYDHLNLNLIWNTATVHVPDLIRQIEPLMPSDE
ncbi:MAG: DUF86 domain-containing protein [Calditrichaeota bacterium]|nr:DUF86 domain-containing protein [Calditrichota bacterium]